MTSSKKDKSLGSKMYTGAASFGRIYAIIGLVITSIIALVLVCWGIYIILHPSKRITKTSATITRTPVCVPSINNNKIQYTCNIEIEFTPINSTEIIKGVISVKSDIDYSRPEHKTIGIYYNKTNPSDYSIDKGAEALTGGIMIGVGIIIVIISYLIYWGTKKSKTFAAGVGVYEGVKLIKNI